MKKCIELAQKGAGNVSPNPMVGCVIVHNGQVIGEGYHEKYGQAHAEVNAVNAVKNKELLKESTLYVSLEPCAHYGLTPPCSDMIVREKIPRVVVGTTDSFAKVAGKGIERMRNAGTDVQVGILENECRELNKRFFTFQEKKRPYIFLKWAETADGYIDYHRTSAEFGKPSWITGPKALLRVHQMRAVEDAILVGTNTALKDNPSLTVRYCEGRNPVRLLLDNRLKVPVHFHLFDNSAKTIVFNSVKDEKHQTVKWVKIDFGKELIPQILDTLYQENILSLIVEGGNKLLESFIDANLWDEAFRFIGEKRFGSGIRAPQLHSKIYNNETIEPDQLIIYRNFF